MAASQRFVLAPNKRVKQVSNQTYNSKYNITFHSADVGIGIGRYSQVFISKPHQSDAIQSFRGRLQTSTYD